MLESRARILLDPDYYSSSSVHPDLAKSAEAGAFGDPLDHYVTFGMREGRKAFHFDEAFYRTHYPQAVQDVEAGLAADLRDHFAKFGYYRGYLPHSGAYRPDNPGGIPFRFGGLWLDAGDALDKIAGHLETGLITDEEAKLLTQWQQNGYVVLQNAIPDELISAALSELERMYSGLEPNVIFLAEQLNADRMQYDPRLKEVPAKALDPHWISPAICNLVLSAPIVKTLSLIFEQKPLASQSLGFYRGSAQGGHQDLAYVTYSQQRALAATWIALEDVEQGAGELFYYERSHTMPEFLYGGQFKSISELRRTGRVTPEQVSADAKEHVGQLTKTPSKYSCPERVFIARRGDVLFWHADLVHGGKPISTTRSRRSVVTHYCPWRIAPLYFENCVPVLRRHKSGGYYSTIYYG